MDIVIKVMMADLFTVLSQGPRRRTGESGGEEQRQYRQHDKIEKNVSLFVKGGFLGGGRKHTLFARKTSSVVAAEAPRHYG